MQNECIFCRIVNRQIPAEFIASNDGLVVIKDKFPKAPIHFLIIPKEHIQDIASLDDTHKDLAGAMLLMARDLAKQFSDDRSFRLVVNTGARAGQSVFHMHFHFLAGTRMNF